MRLRLGSELIDRSYLTVDAAVALRQKTAALGLAPLELRLRAALGIVARLPAEPGRPTVPSENLIPVSFGGR